MDHYIIISHNITPDAHYPHNFPCSDNYWQRQHGELLFSAVCLLSSKWCVPYFSHVFFLITLGKCCVINNRIPSIKTKLHMTVYHCKGNWYGLADGCFIKEVHRVCFQSKTFLNKMSYVMFIVCCATTDILIGGWAPQRKKNLMRWNEKLKKRTFFRITLSIHYSKDWIFLQSFQV